MDFDTTSESLTSQMQGALAPEGQAPFQASATPQMAGQRLARREPPGSAMTALQRLTRAGPLPARCALSWHFREALVVPKSMGHGTRLLPRTRGLGLSLGDRACLALAVSRRVPVWTADRAWLDFESDIPIKVIR
jgi:hypothetical protein